jgi:hypothetical protein
MLDLFNTPTPQKANYQEFYGGGTVRDWVKPRGASMVRIMIIGAGGGGDTGNTAQGGGGGGSGAITSWIGPAMFIPDILRITVAAGGAADSSAVSSSVIYQAKDGTGYTLLIADGGNGGIGIAGGAAGTSMTSNYFCASGIFTSIAGQAGVNGGDTGAGTNQAASATTFLSGGAGGAGSAGTVGGSVTPNYGYPALPTTTAGGTVVGANGYFNIQPIPVGCGGAGGTTNVVGTGSSGGRGGLGCGGGGAGEDATSSGSAGGRGGDGAVFIWAW